MRPLQIYFPIQTLSHPNLVQAFKESVELVTKTRKGQPGQTALRHAFSAFLPQQRFR